MSLLLKQNFSGLNNLYFVCMRLLGAITEHKFYVSEGNLSEYAVHYPLKEEQHDLSDVRVDAVV